MFSQLRLICLDVGILVEGEILDHPDLVFMMVLFVGVCLAACPCDSSGEIF